jgi:hypothetical protein
MPAPKVRIATEKYITTWGHPPRGKGHWTFELPRSGRLFLFSGTFSDAVKAALREAKKYGDDTIVVEP